MLRLKSVWNPTFLMGSVIFYILIHFYGCTPKITNVNLPIDSLRNFSAAGNELMAEQWWTDLGDTTLNRLINQAMDSNLDLAFTWQQILAARATV